MIRFAIYYTPPPTSLLSQVASLWFGRTGISLHPEESQVPRGLSRERFREITAAPFHYGFHATIKPPFQLAPGKNIDLLRNRLHSFALEHTRFVLPPLEVSSIDNFFCLRPVTSSAPLRHLAEGAVRSLDDFRQTPPEKELAWRRQNGLTPGQEEMLQTWGYPYVMDEFRFHLTLTGRIDDREERLLIDRELKKRFQKTLMQSLPFTSLSLFVERDRKPMMLSDTFPLAP